MSVSGDKLSEFQKFSFLTPHSLRDPDETLKTEEYHCPTLALEFKKQLSNVTRYVLNGREILPERRPTRVKTSFDTNEHQPK